MIAVDPRSEMLFEMGQCAFRLGKLFAAESERAETHAQRLEFFELFDRCGFAVRMSVALELRLRREARTEARALADNRRGERDAPERDPVERDPPESYAERDVETEREREREPVSLPVLLRSLDGVVASASALPGPEPAELPTLRELLAKVKAGTGPGSGSPLKPSAGGGLRTRLAASAMVSATAPAFAGPPHPSGRRAALAFRRATGPPR